MRVIVALAFALGLITQAAPAPAQDAEALRREMERDFAPEASKIAAQ